MVDIDKYCIGIVCPAYADWKYMTECLHAFVQASNSVSTFQSECKSTDMPYTYTSTNSVIKMVFTLDDTLEFVVVGCGNHESTETTGMHVSLLLQTCREQCDAIIMHGVCHSTEANRVIVSNRAMAYGGDVMTQDVYKYYAPDRKMDDTFLNYGIGHVLGAQWLVNWHTKVPENGTVDDFAYVHLKFKLHSSLSPLDPVDTSSQKLYEKLYVSEHAQRDSESEAPAYIWRLPAFNVTRGSMLSPCGFCKYGDDFKYILSGEGTAVIGFDASSYHACTFVDMFDLPLIAIVKGTMVFEDAKIPKVLQSHINGRVYPRAVASYQAAIVVIEIARSYIRNVMSHPEAAASYSEKNENVKRFRFTVKKVHKSLEK